MSDRIRLSDLEIPVTRQRFIDDQTQILTVELRPNAIKMYQVGDFVRLKKDGPEYTIVAKDARKVYLVQGRGRRRETLDQTKLPKEQQRPAPAGVIPVITRPKRRKIQLEDE